MLVINNSIDKTGSATKSNMPKPKYFKIPEVFRLDTFSIKLGANLFKPQ